MDPAHLGPAGRRRRKTATFPAKTGRYVRLDILEEQSGNGSSANVAEITVTAGAQAVPRDQMRVLGVDSEDPDGYSAQYAIDGKPETFWHDEWRVRHPPLPHTLVLDLGAVYAVDQVQYLPRQDGGPWGNATRYALFVGTEPAPGLRYCYSLTASKPEAESDPSNVACGTTAPLLVPEAPTGLMLTYPDAGSVRLTWTQAGTQHTGFQVQDCIYAQGLCTLADQGPVRSPTLRTITKPAVIGDTHCYQVLALGEGGRSAPSPKRCVVLVPGKAMVLTP